MKNKTLLLVQSFVAIYFLLLFINAKYEVVTQTSPLTGLVELLTIPAIILQVIIFLIASYRLIIKKQWQPSLILSLALSITIITLMFVVK
ncbi:MAG: hypothetical protein ACTHLE_24475 [Agriterribacter sp.]